jgi:hypothetical protein
MACARQILRRAAEFHEHGAFVDELARHRPDNMDTQHPVGLRIRQHFHEAVGRQAGFSPRVRQKRKLASLVLNFLLLELVFASADRCYFRSRIDDRWVTS